MEMKRCCLRYPYFSVKTQNGLSYGGSQTWCSSRTMQKYGCGVVAMGDVLLYMGIHRLSCSTDLQYGILREDGNLSYPRYERYLRKIRRRYLGIIPGFGVPGFLVPHAMNRYFRHYKMDFRARWCISHEKLYSRIEEAWPGICRFFWLWARIFRSGENTSSVCIVRRTDCIFPPPR